MAEKISEWEIMASPEISVPDDPFFLGFTGARYSDSWLHHNLIWHNLGRPQGLEERVHNLRYLPVRTEFEVYSGEVGGYHDSPAPRESPVPREFKPDTAFVLGEWSFTSPTLRASLDDLDRIDEWIEEGDEPPSTETVALAKRILRTLHDIVPKRYDVYPTPEGEVAVHARWVEGSSVMALCEPNGEILCLVNIERRLRNARYRGPSDPGFMRFIRAALDELESLDE